AVLVLPDGQVVPRLRWVEARADSAGTYRLCGVPVGADVTVAAAVEEEAGGVAPPAAAVPGAAPVLLQVPPSRRVGRVDVAMDSTVTAPAAFAGVLLDGNGAPVPFVEVRLPGLSRAILSNEGGRFRLEGIPPGTHQVTITREGYAPLSAQVPFAPNRLVEHRIVLTPPPVH
ncbi:MAG: carboxypeptidase regulatory-like domain-containing protein, partial [Gemmatimonadetes bacterium]|nr:carboxypeptidase regulatory-like domain-containing protein [Gemmatimonadota bacterium]